MDADELVALEIALSGHEAVNRIAGPARQALDLIADKWSVLVLAAVGAGTSRSGELARRIEGITRKMLTQTLRSLERNGLIDRHVYAEVPPRVEYRLTELGVSLLPLVCSLCHWAEVNMARVEAARARYDGAGVPGASRSGSRPPGPAAGERDREQTVQDVGSSVGTSDP